MPCGAPLYTMMSTALPFIFTSAPRNGSELSGDLSDESSASDTKLLLAAQDDAAAFIASDGQIRGTFLEAALRRLRSRSGAQIYDDRQLALALLSRAD